MPNGFKSHRKKQFSMASKNWAPWPPRSFVAVFRKIIGTTRVIQLLYSVWLKNIQGQDDRIWFILFLLCSWPLITENSWRICFPSYDLKRTATWPNYGSRWIKINGQLNPRWSMHSTTQIRTTLVLHYTLGQKSNICNKNVLLNFCA